MKELVLFITCRLHIGTHFYHFQRLLRIELIWFSLINTIIKFSEISSKLLFMKIWFDILFSNWWMFIYCKMDSGDCVMKRVTEWEERTLVFCSCNSRYDGEDGDSGEDSGDHLTRTVRGPGVRSEAEERTTSSCPPVLLSSSLSLISSHSPPTQSNKLTFWHSCWLCDSLTVGRHCDHPSVTVWQHHISYKYSTQFPSCASDGSYIGPVLSQVSCKAKDFKRICPINVEEMNPLCYRLREYLFFRQWKGERKVRR